MSKRRSPQLDSLAAEAAAYEGEAEAAEDVPAAPVPEAAQELPPPPPPQAPPSREAMQRLLYGATAGLGSIICRRAGVSPLEHDEIAALSGAIGELLEVYGLADRMDPRTAAWIGLGLTLGGIAARRAPLPARSEPTPEPAVDPPPPEAPPHAEPFPAGNFAKG